MQGCCIVIVSAIAAVGPTVLYPNRSVAQITPDATLPNNSVVDSVNKTLNINGGTSAGGNLFHSFKDFSVPSGWEAVFKNGADIQNILTRVTGKSISEIDGLIKANGSANLFLMNPNGIIFGENASLDINGSFVGSTANGIGIDNQDFFNLLNSQPNSQLLTIKPDALFFNQIQGGKIATSSSQLRVPNGRSLLLVGGDIIINGGSLRADGGRIDLAGLAENGVLGLNINNNELSLSVPDNATRADISVVNSASIDVRAGGGGSIGVNARNLEVTQGSLLAAGIGKDLGSAESVGGDISINATDKVIFDGQGSDKFTGATSSVEPEAQGKAGGVEITTASLQILNGAELGASTLGIGDAGSVLINATDVIFDGQGSDQSTGANSGVADEAQGDAGGVEITTGSLQILNGAYLSASTFGIGDAGSVKINATDVIFDGQGSNQFTGAVSQVESGAEGNAGGVEITTGSLQILNGAYLSASTFGIGDAGSVKINATDVIFDGQGSDKFTGATSSVEPEAQGKAGGVEITTGSLQILNGAELGASTLGIGDAGSVKINATDKVIFDGQGSDQSTGANSGVADEAQGDAGGVEITTDSLQILNGAYLSASTFEIGDAGSVKINATDVIFDGQGSNQFTGAVSQVESGAEGNAGGVEITTASLQILNGGDVSASTFGIGDAGSVKINATDVIFDGQGNDGFTGATSSVEPEAEGNAGGVEITTGSLQILNGAELGASTLGIGDAGSVLINATDVIFDGQGSDRFTGANSGVADEAQGDAGGVEITTASLQILNGAYLSASTFEIGDAGSVKINATDVIFDGQGSNQFTGAVSQVESGAEGNAGGVEITTDSLQILNGGDVSASTFGNGDAGSVLINATDKVIFDGQGNDGFTGAVSSVHSTAQGKAGGVEITTASLQILNGAQLGASTLGVGDAGSVLINATDKVIFDGQGNDGFTGTASSVQPGAEGKAGGVEITTASLQILNGAELGASSFGSGEAGALTVNADSILLDNQGEILANTIGGGGDIFLNSPLFVLRSGSSITTNASGDNITGGNITIDGKNGFIVALPWENSDIRADSQNFRGGNVTIKNTAGIYGIQLRTQPLPNSSDITATGATPLLEGNIQINTPDTDPNNGLIELRVNLVDASNQISTACNPGGSQFENTFVSTGRGGLPMNPTQPLQETNTLQSWVKLKPQSENSANLIVKPSLKKVSNHNKVARRNQIIEATGWIVDKDGNIEFVAQANQINPQSTKQTPASCSVSR